VAATTNRPSMALPSRRTPMWVSVRSHSWCCPSLMLQPAPVGIRGDRSSNGCCPSSFIRPLWGFAVSRVRTGDLSGLIRSHKIVKVASSNSGHCESPQGPDERRGARATSVRTPLTRIPTGAGCSIREGQQQPWEQMETRMVVRLRGRAMLGRLVVAATKYNFVGTF